MGLGLTQGTIKRVTKDGQEPSIAFLSAIQRGENASLNWMGAGIGEPYLVSRCTDDTECSERLNEYLEEDWRIDVLTDGSAYAVVLTQPGQYQAGKKMVDYTILEVLTGAGPETMALVADCGHQVSLVRIGGDTLRDLERGRIGTFALVGDDKHPGILAARQPINRAILPEVAEPHGRYQPKSAIQAMFDDLNKADQRRLIAIAAALGNLSGAGQPREYTATADNWPRVIEDPDRKTKKSKTEEPT